MDVNIDKSHLLAENLLTSYYKYMKLLEKYEEMGMCPDTIMNAVYQSSIKPVDVDSTILMLNDKLNYAIVQMITDLNIKDLLTHD